MPQLTRHEGALLRQTSSILNLWIIRVFITKGKFQPTHMSCEHSKRALIVSCCCKYHTLRSVTNFFDCVNVCSKAGIGEYQYHMSHMELLEQACVFVYDHHPLFSARLSSYSMQLWRLHSFCIFPFVPWLTDATTDSLLWKMQWLQDYSPHTCPLSFSDHCISSLRWVFTLYSWLVSLLHILQFEKGPTSTCDGMQSITWFSTDRTNLREMIVRWVIAFPKTLMCHLRDEHDIRRELKVMLICIGMQFVLAHCDLEHLRREFVANWFPLGFLEPALLQTDKTRCPIRFDWWRGTERLNQQLRTCWNGCIAGRMGEEWFTLLSNLDDCRETTHSQIEGCLPLEFKHSNQDMCVCTRVWILVALSILQYEQPMG